LALNIKKGNTSSFSRINIGKKAMDKIWDGNPLKSEVIGRCGGDEKTNDHAEQSQSNAFKK